jgi:uncharacterized protein (DUF1330 family)
MTVYVLAQLKFTDRPAYERYRARFSEVFRKFEGKVLAADESPQVLEGAWDGDKVVLLAFPDEAAARAFVFDPEYQEISKDRHAGADTVSLLVSGL